MLCGRWEKTLKSIQSLPKAVWAVVRVLDCLVPSWAVLCSRAARGSLTLPGEDFSHLLGPPALCHTLLRGELLFVPAAYQGSCCCGSTEASLEVLDLHKIIPNVLQTAFDLVFLEAVCVWAMQQAVAVVWTSLSLSASFILLPFCWVLCSPALCMRGWWCWSQLAAEGVINAEEFKLRWHFPHLLRF